MERLDEKACLDLRGRLRSESALFLSGDHSASVMTGVLRELSALVTSRYHAAVLSMETGCPIVAVSMDERLDNLMKELSDDSCCLLDVKDKYLGRKISQALSEAVIQQTAIQNHILNYTKENKRKLARMGIFMKHYLETKLYVQPKI